MCNSVCIIGYITFTNKRSPFPIFWEVFTPSRPQVRPSYLHIVTRNEWTLPTRVFLVEHIENMMGNFVCRNVIVIGDARRLLA